MNLNKITTQTEAYFLNLSTYLQEQSISNLFSDEIDHLAVKLYDSSDYENFLKIIFDQAEQIYEASLNGRRISIAKLIKPISAKKEIFYLEIMEPKPEKIGKTFVGVEHCEVYVPGLTEIEKELKDKRINYELKNNGFHNTIILPFNSGQEIKFTDHGITEVIEHEKAAGLIRKLK